MPLRGEATPRAASADQRIEPDLGTRHAVDDFFPDDLPADVRYDVIAFNDVFEHVDDPARVLDACGDRLRPGGLLMINLPSSRGVFFRVASYLDRVAIHGPYQRLWQKGFPSPHRSYFDPEGLARLAQRHGFYQVYRDRLDAFQREGLWQRLRFDTTAPLLASAALWLGICLAAPLLRRLPADISLHIFRRAAADTSP
jgi:predicted SAM-dependent methyltransferase